jgi:DNA-binding MarR family transcriptional regulator
MVGMGYMHHERCRADRRSVRGRLTYKGQHVREFVHELFEGHADALQSEGVLHGTAVEDINEALRRMEQYWGKQIRFIY